tara:strand:+ start:2618 stop:3295 length:678 start_codon:yes stop_codon:yes gene_type:complete
MTGIVLINKKGDVKSHNIKQVVRTELYKKCGFKIDKAFERRATWDVTVSNKKYCIELWAKNEGNANTENKYDFPPPVDSELYFGTCCLIRVDKENNIISLSKEEWYSVYEKLFGGFEDIEVEDEYSEDELAEVPKEMKTKTGYLKDDFVVDDCNNNDDNDDDLEDEEEEEEIVEDDDNDDDDDDDDDDSENCWVNKEEEEEEEEEEEDEENDLQAEMYIYSDEDN